MTNETASEAPRICFAYLRVSTRRQDEDNQRLQIKGYAEHHNLQIPDDDGWFIDHAVSGTIPPLKRPGFRDMYELLQAMKATNEANQPTNVIVYEISRLGRNFWEILEVLKALEDSWPIISTSPKEAFLQIENRSMRPLFLSILAWAAEREREMLVQRTIEGISQAKTERRHSGNVPLGYTIHRCVPGVCVVSAGQQCEQHGRLALTDDGRAVLTAIGEIGEKKIRPRDLRGRVSPEIGDSAYNRFAILRNVKLYRDPSSALVAQGV
ncbi:MAG: recombinase family protein [Nitrososphaerota archaeon]|nr:recombinase family protein [Nitrososphaerota archaeon]